VSLLTPDLYYSSLFAVDLDELAGRGVDTILIDLDNTILPRGRLVLEDRAYEWAALAKKRFKVGIVSNNSKRHPAEMAAQLGVPLVTKALKPSTRGVKAAMTMLGSKPAATALIGDQMFTDVLAGNRADVTTVLVGPLVAQDLPHTLVLRRLQARIMAGRAPLA
jgi:HAD superfamily phosphatase (TIGR01668 family)